MSDHHFTVNITGMHCASCVGKAEKALKSVAAVRDAQVNLATESAYLTLDKDMTPAINTQLKKALKRVGYQLEAAEFNQQTAHAQQYLALKRAVWLAVLLTLPVFIIEMGGHAVPAFHHWIQSHLSGINGWLQFILTSLVLFGPGWVFFRIGVPALLRGAPEMNSLVALGSFAAWSYSTVVLFFPQLIPEQNRHFYFEAAAVIVTLILVGRLLEARAKGQTSRAIQYLLDLQQKTATVIRGDSVESVPIEAVQQGDWLRVKPGEKCPLDGDVVDGESYVDESMITGESMPVRKIKGDKVIGGTLNQQGSLTVAVTHTQQVGVLAQMVRMVMTAQADKLPIQALVDRVTAVFVPVVISIAVLTFLLWWWLGPEPSFTPALIFAVTVLIIACPCAMGLATPMSIMVATGRAAQLGILFRQAQALQQLSQVDTVVLDKTGTLTQGAPTVTDVWTIDGVTEQAVLQWAASIEQYAEHPLADAIVKVAGERNIRLLPVSQFKALTGQGVEAIVEGKKVILGGVKMGAETAYFDTQLAQLTAQAATPVYVWVDNRLVGLLAIKDPLKETTHQAIADLHQQGYQVVMLTGDHEKSAQAVANVLQIDTVIAQALPEDKQQYVKALQQQGRRVAFLGDGINDAPTLAQAEVGIAMGNGSDIAIESADVVLVKGQLTTAVTAIEMSRKCIRNIKENLFWAFAYNAALIPIAAGVLYPTLGIQLSPMLAAGAMALSSVFVISNALRLNRVGRHA